MKIQGRLKIVCALIVSIPIYANSMELRCNTANGDSNTSVQFSFSDLPSKRLNSDIVYSRAGSTAVISNLDVAQYKHTKREIYFLSDDVGGNWILKLKVVRTGSKGFFRGKVIEYNSSGAVMFSEKVKCSLL